ncbi:Ig-like domain-containing protein [Magnetovibrio sp.]|uniref:Ig-like domain-containing protein n=1 Tax=Magnetovibrio sp. TaxID=2024836 RepID=UPI002F929B89
MRTLTFTLDTQTGSDAMAPATVTITEQDDGTLSFTVSNEGDGDNLIGDLRGLFFDVSDDLLLGTLNVNGDDVTEVNQSGEVSNLGGGSTSSGVPDSPYEIGVEIGTPGQAGDDIQTTTFILSSSLRGLTLDDLALESFTVRQTSVGIVNGDRSASDKLYGDAPYPVNAIDDALAVDEDQTLIANLFANDIDLDAPDNNNDGIADMTVTAINDNGVLVGQSIELAQGVSFVVSGNGTIEIDARDADYLSFGEEISQTYTYSVYDGNGGSDDAQFTVTVTGVNDDPTAISDTNATDEQTVIRGNVLDNDSDIDRLDTISVASVNGDQANIGAKTILESGALLTMYADGSYDYDPNGAFNGLNDGDSAQDSFTYEIVDNHGAVSTATVNIDISGIGGTVGDPLDGDHFGTFTNKKGTAEHEVSNIVLYLKDDVDAFTKVKIDGWYGGETDLDDVNLSGFLNENYSEYDLFAVSIKAGNNHNRDLGPGEGQLFLLDGDEDIDYVAGTDAPESMSHDVLEAHADITLQYSSDLFS